MGEFGGERRVVVLLGLVGALLDGRRVPAGVEMGFDGCGSRGRDGTRVNGPRVRGARWSGDGGGG